MYVVCVEVSGHLARFASLLPHVGPRKPAQAVRVGSKGLRAPLAVPSIFTQGFTFRKEII